jgi:deoxyuridine 5'-triphosphate nucleotidohydrolase
VTLNLEIKKLHPEANLPTKANPADAGLDLYALDVTEIPAWGSRLVSTGIAVSILEGWCGVIKSRSSVALKQSLEVGAGVIDSGYTGEVKVLLRNHSEKIKWLNQGDRIAQLLLVPVPKVNVVEVKEFTTVVGERGDGGWGSSGR